MIDIKCVGCKTIICKRDGNTIHVGMIIVTAPADLMCAKCGKVTSIPAVPVLPGVKK